MSDAASLNHLHSLIYAAILERISESSVLGGVLHLIFNYVVLIPRNIVRYSNTQPGIFRNQKAGVFSPMKKMNVSIVECIEGWLYFLKRYALYPVLLGNFYQRYENYIEILFRFWTRKYPVKGRLRNGNTVIIKNERSLKFPWEKMGSDGMLFGFEHNIKLDTEKEISIIRSRSTDREVRLVDSINNGDVFAIFINGQYNCLPVNDMVVIDVGSNIGDSSIYFALHGASSVIALDPIPYNYKIAKENITSNNFNKIINVILAGCDSETRLVQIPFRQNGRLMEPSDGTQLKVGFRLARYSNEERFVRVKMYSLADLLDKNNIVGKALLKMDCEGCEYRTILYSTCETLRRFSHIFIEYHHGYRDLREKLISCGFKVSVSKPTYIRTHDIGDPMYSGTIFAVNQTYKECV